ncbi:hypothetical protein BJ878DRAFT_577827 [Calycina marina]|uniref:Uncharacterized protein n=1 Tax=Calycina marina TaxID=1763456 RepID=A0A9P7YY81_9HELO|nr:hypothetical protein BJ878DRAFT_577827 [Calycina marina]
MPPKQDCKMRFPAKAVPLLLACSSFVAADQRRSSGADKDQVTPIFTKDIKHTIWLDTSNAVSASDYASRIDVPAAFNPDTRSHQTNLSLIGTGLHVSIKDVDRDFGTATFFNIIIEGKTTRSYTDKSRMVHRVWHLLPRAGVREIILKLWSDLVVRLTVCKV